MCTSCADLRDVIQQRFVKSLNGVGMHLHAVGDELDEVGNRIISDVAASLQGGPRRRKHEGQTWTITSSVTR